MKYERDSIQRNLTIKQITEQISSRRLDYIKYINTQIENAEILFHMRRVNSKISDLELEVQTIGLNILDDIHKLLRIHTRCNLDFKMNTAQKHTLIVNDLHIEQKDLFQILNLLIPNLKQLQGEHYKLKSGFQGLMTVISILGLVDKRIGIKEVLSG